MFVKHVRDMCRRDIGHVSSGKRMQLANASEEQQKNNHNVLMCSTNNKAIEVLFGLFFSDVGVEHTLIIR